MMKNTASWVDEDYGKRLADQHRGDTISLTYDTIPEGVLYSKISDMRKSKDYLCETKILMKGFGVSEKILIKVYFLSRDPSGQYIFISALLYSLKGKVIPSSKRGIQSDGNGNHLIHVIARCKIALSKHAHTRLFERLRTNSREDIMETLKLVARCNVPMDKNIGDRVSLTLTGIGRLELVLDNLPDGKAWVAKTFIAEKK